MYKKQIIKSILCVALSAATFLTGLPVAASQDGTQQVQTQQEQTTPVMATPTEGDVLPVAEPTPNSVENTPTEDVPPVVEGEPSPAAAEKEVPVVKAAPQWIKNEDGTWSLSDDQGNLLTGWQFVGDKWYFMNESGIMLTGWLKRGDTYYYLTANGSMAVGWVKVGHWYYLNESGAMLSGWQTIDGEDYYLGSPASGAMVTGWQTIDGVEYCFHKSGNLLKNQWVTKDEVSYYAGEDGKLVTGPYLVEGTPYYFQENGVLLTKKGWVQQGTDWYYTNEDGSLHQDWLKVAGSWYYMQPDKMGLMATGWIKLGSTWYYLKPNNGTMYTGWHKINNRWYYFAGGGYMATGWRQLGNNWYYFGGEDSGKMVTGWGKVDDQWYYFGGADDGVRRTGWQTIGKKRYYMDADGIMQTGWRLLDDKWYYFGDVEDGALKTGWQKVYSRWYYMDADGVMQTGWQKIGSKTYYFGNEGSGKMAVGWQLIDEKWYYFGEADDGAMKTGWQLVDEKWYYMDTDGIMQTGWKTISGKRYYFYNNGSMAVSTTIDGTEIDANGVAVSSNNSYFSDAPSGLKTVKNYLQNALKPVGTTLYIWGGGHDWGTDADSRRAGVNPEWEAFYNTQNASYDYDDHRWEYGHGLDCSGFVGWVSYNTVNATSGKSSLVSTSTLTTGVYRDKGWATYYTNPKTFKPGDVVSMNGHTYIVIGVCDDGSMVIAHATPPAVQISGTVVPSTGSSNSQAVKLARSYMEKYYPNWYFTSRSAGKSYFNNITLARWITDGSGMFTDPDGYQDMSAEEVLKDLYNE